MLLWFIRFVKGYVRFLAAGKTPERLINLTAQRGIILWNLLPSEQGLEASVSAADYRRMRTLARQAGVRTGVLQKHGAPFWAAKYRARIGLPVGAALGAALLVLLSQFIWTVQIESTPHVSEERLRVLLAESGVRAGVLKKAADTDQAKRDILLQEDELSWLSVNIVGSCANIALKEKSQKPAVEKNASPCNLKACADGVITDMLVGDGVTEVKKGSGVRKGDLLVSGVQLTTQNGVRYVSARGKVMADVLYQKEFSTPKKWQSTAPAQRQTSRYCLSFLGARIPCSASFVQFDNAVFTETTDWLSVNGVRLPLGLITETAGELRTEEKQFDQKGAERYFRKELLLWELFEKGGGKPVSKKLVVSHQPNSYACTAQYVFNENIAESVDFSVKEGYN